jgi:hypothetical protein
VKGAVLEASVDREIDAFIERRAAKNGARRPEEAAYAASVRRYHARQRKETRAEWYGHHMDHAERLERTAARLAASHRDAARKLMEES